ncbi:MAG TPA: kelch motif-containing protein, partial [Streptomyces sp.]|nr:kelch motif-containing protein [Streptomyces sp.]
KVTPSVARVYVEAEKRGKQYQTGSEDNYRVQGLRRADSKNVYGIAQKLSFDKKDFQGIKDTYEFDPVAERYIKVDPMHEARWYPTLTTLEDGKVLSVSGLDDIGQVVPGKNEIYDPDTKKWEFLPRKRYFPTYPSLHLTSDNKIFYSGANAGYGPDDRGRTPGLWNLETNGFRKIPGLSDPDALETAMSVPLPPSQSHKFMVLGGGGVGESKKATAKTRIVDLKEPSPRFVDGPELYGKARYPSSVVLPDDTVLTTNGSGDYRGRSETNVLKAEVYDPRSNTKKAVADPLVGRNYHSGALLLPDGRVMTFGSDSLFSDAANTKPGRFEQQIDIYTPSYLHQKGKRPQLVPIEGDARTVRLGGTATFKSKDAGAIKKMRLIRPSSFTHVTNVEQSSVALDFKETKDGITVALPEDPSLVPPGWWMVTAVDGKGVPSKSAWLKVPRTTAAQAPTTTPLSP